MGGIPLKSNRKPMKNPRKFQNNIRFTCKKQNQPSGRCKLKTVAVPEQRRWRIESAVLSVERFSPLFKGTAFAGANCRG